MTAELADLRKREGPAASGHRAPNTDVRQQFYPSLVVILFILIFWGAVDLSGKGLAYDLCMTLYVGLIPRAGQACEVSRYQASLHVVDAYFFCR